jgi:hypothetical protein
MLKHETKLIDPDADAIVAALSAATADANKRCRARLLEDKLEKWRKFARAAATKPEGWEMFRGGRGGVPATQLLAAWWTDAAGRKHVVLRGRRVEHDEAKRLLYKEELDKRPPLWHAYPEYVCRRTVGDQSQIVCACGCGAVGAPESLGWMGETCGPCFDRKEEVGAGALRANLPGVLYGDREPLRAIACSPDGNRVAAGEGDISVTYWDISNRTRTTIKFSGQRVVDVAITSDARHLLVVGINTLMPGGLFAAFDLSTDPLKQLDVALEAPPGGWRIAALPDPGFALLHRWNTTSAISRGEVIRVPSGDVVRGTDLTRGYFGRIAVSHDGALFATPGDPVGVFDLATMRAVRAVRGMQSLVAFSHDGARLFGAHIGTVKAHDIGSGKPVAEGCLVGSKRGGSYLVTNDHITTLAVDPGGDAVFAGTGQGRVFVFDPNTLARRAVFDWHLGHVAGLAVSADGSRLFSSGGDGCVKVWPIRDLLRGT